MRAPFFARWAAAGMLCAAAVGLAAWSLQADFAALWAAGGAVAADRDPYANGVGLPGGTWDGVAVFAHSRFLHPPLVAAFMRPLGTLPFLTAKATFTALSVVALLVAVVLAARLAGLGRREDAGVFALTALFLPAYLAIDRGQVDPVVLLLVVAALVRPEGGAGAGLLLGLAALLRPALLGLLPFLALARRRSLLGWTVATLLGLGAASVALTGREATAEFVDEVVPRALRWGDGGAPAARLPLERLGRQRTTALALGVATIDGRTYAQSSFDPAPTVSVPRLLAGDASPVPASIAAYLVLGGALAFAGRRTRGRAEAEQLLLFGALPLTVITAPEGPASALVLALPLAASGLGLWVRGRLARAASVLLVLGFAAAGLPGLPGPRFVIGALLLVAAVAAQLVAWREESAASRP